MSAKKVIGVGQCSWDLLSRVDHYPASDEKIDILEWQEQGGGPVSTALVTLKKLSGAAVNCDFFGVIGDDSEGRKIREAMEQAGIDCSGIKVTRPGGSQVSFVSVEKGSGLKTIFCRRTAPELELKPSDVNGKVHGDLLLLDGVMEEACLAAAREARDHRVPVLLGSGRLRRNTLELAALSDHWVGSEVVARELGWDGDPGRIRDRFMKNGTCLRSVTFTVGARGSVTITPDTCFETPAHLVKVVDTTGAGDVFHGAYAYGIIQQWSLRHTVGFASVVAALKCRKLGGRAGIPTPEEALKVFETKQQA